jgi:hypothetical protein
MNTANKNVSEIKFLDVEETADRILEKLKKIEAITDEALLKASISHSLIVVRKVSEDKIEDLKKILD